MQRATCELELLPASTRMLAMIFAKASCCNTTAQARARKMSKITRFLGKLGREGVQIVSCVKWHNLASNGIGEEGAAAIAKAVDKNKSVFTIHIACPSCSECPSLASPNQLC